MTQLAMGLLALQPTSDFGKARANLRPPAPGREHWKVLHPSSAICFGTWQADAS